MSCRPPRAARITHRLRLAAFAFLIVPVATAGGFLDSQSPDSAKKDAPLPWAEPADPIPEEGGGWTPTLAKLENGRARVLRARQNKIAAQAIYQKARTRHYPRGEAFEVIRDRLESMTVERDNAENDFVALVENLRKSGVPMGLLSSAMDFSDQLQAERAARGESASR